MVVQLRLQLVCVMELLETALARLHNFGLLALPLHLVAVVDNFVPHSWPSLVARNFDIDLPLHPVAGLEPAFVGLGGLELGLEHFYLDLLGHILHRPPALLGRIASLPHSFLHQTLVGLLLALQNQQPIYQAFVFLLQALNLD